MWATFFLMDIISHCPLCKSGNEKKEFLTNFSKRFIHCADCDLIFALKKDLPTIDEELQRYQKHQNSILNEGYVQFLNRIVQPATTFLNDKKQGLDYGCGPNPTLSLLINQLGLECENYDPIFFPEFPQKQYEFIFATECLEHFHYPNSDFEKISNLILPDGILAIMTEFWQSEEQFKSWYYTRDWTHVSLFHLNTFKWICKNWGYKILHTDQKRVIILQKL